MQYVQERNLSDFPFWSGGERAMERISSSPDYDEEVLEEFLMKHFSKTPTEGEINDFFWFYQDEIMEALGWREEGDDDDEEDYDDED